MKRSNQQKHGTKRKNCFHSNYNYNTNNNNNNTMQSKKNIVNINNIVQRNAK